MYAECLPTPSVSFLALEDMVHSDLCFPPWSLQVIQGITVGTPFQFHSLLVPHK